MLVSGKKEYEKDRTKGRWNRVNKFQYMYKFKLFIPVSDVFV